MRSLKTDSLGREYLQKSKRVETSNKVSLESFYLIIDFNINLEVTCVWITWE